MTGALPPKIKKRNRRSGHIRTSPDDRAVVIVSTVLTILMILVCFYPFWFTFLTSITALQAGQHAAFLFPSSPTFKIYAQVLKDGTVFHGMMISAFRVIISTTCTVIFTSMFAFLMTRDNMPGRKIIYRYAIITMYVSGGLIPGYIVMRTYGLFNDFFVYVVPGLVSMFFVILTKTFIESLPPEMEEAARVDGTGFMSTFLRIILPLSTPILATIAIFTAVGAWNSYMDNYMYVQNLNLQTVQMILYNYVVRAQQMVNLMRGAMAGGGNGVSAAQAATMVTPDTIRTATTIVSVIPIMLIYPFLQKYFAKGIMMGAVKG